MCTHADEFADDGGGLLVEFGSTPRAVARAAAAAAAAGPAAPTAKAYVPRKARRSQLPIEALPKVAIVGRPNVGKSALFNRLAGSSVAVVYDYPGVTRDKLYTRAFWGDKEYCLIDTGGSSRVGVCVCVGGGGGECVRALSVAVRVTVTPRSRGGVVRAATVRCRALCRLRYHTRSWQAA
jgi:hypothetical protein